MLFKSKNNGFSTLEAIISVAILSIGGVGIFGMVAASQSALDRAAVREELAMQAQEIFEVINDNQENALLFNQDLTACAVSSDLKAAISDSELQKYLNWCVRIKGEAGLASSYSKRKIIVAEKSVYDPVNKITSKFYVVTIELTNEAGRANITFRRVLNAG